MLKRLLVAIGLIATSPALADTPALGWLTGASEREGVWRDHGRIEFPSGRLFVGDPTSSSDQHMRDPRAAPAAAGQLYTFGDGRDGQNYLIWIQFSGQTPVSKGEVLGFGVDAATIGLGSVEAGQALIDLGERNLDAGKGDSFDFLIPHIQATQHFAKWLPLPGSNTSIFLVTTGNDGGLEASWMHDSSGAVSGILIDIRGRSSDGLFLDKLLPIR